MQKNSASGGRNTLKTLLNHQFINNRAEGAEKNWGTPRYGGEFRGDFSVKIWGSGGIGGTLPLLTNAGSPPGYGGGFRGAFWTGFGGSGGIGGSSPPRLERGLYTSLP